MESAKKPEGNMNLAYCASHTFKHTLWGFHNQDSHIMTLDSLAGLWELRFNPRYHSYADAHDIPLAQIIGLNPNRLELDIFFGFKKSDRDGFRNLALQQEGTSYIGESLVIPDVTDTCKRGILTDVVVAIKRKLLEDPTLILGPKEDYPDPINFARKMIEKNGLEISINEFIQMAADRQSYATFLVGYTFPKSGEGTKAEDAVHRIMEKRRTNNPLEYIETLVGRKFN